MTYVTKSGKVLTEADIEALADKCERGFETVEFSDPDLPPLTLTFAESGALMLAATHADIENWHPAIVTYLTSAMVKLAELREVKLAELREDPA